jgi:hypothetical protein
MGAPQTGFTFTTPTQNSDGSACVVGEVTEYVAQITPANGAEVDHAFTAPATWVPGSSQNIPFTALIPPFVPSVGISYKADMEAADASGISIPSGSISWTQGGPMPDAPTNLTVQ